MEKVPPPLRLPALRGVVALLNHANSGLLASARPHFPTQISSTAILSDRSLFGGGFLPLSQKDPPPFGWFCRETKTPRSLRPHSAFEGPRLRAPTQRLRLRTLRAPDLDARGPRPSASSHAQGRLGGGFGLLHDRDLWLVGLLDACFVQM